MATSKSKKGRVLGCANCQMHCWTPPKNTTFLPCPDCGKLCKDEHFEKVHKHHCQYLVKSELSTASQHDAKSSAICLKEASAGGDKYKVARSLHSPTYRCIIKGNKLLKLLSAVGTTQFPLDGLPGDGLDKAVYVMQLLIDKIQLTNVYRQAGKTCVEVIEQIKNIMWYNRVTIWESRTITSVWGWPYEFESFNDELIEKASKKLLKEGKISVKDPFQLWKLVILVNNIIDSMYVYKILSNLKDPIRTFPEEYRQLVDNAMNSRYMVIADDIFDCLSTEVIPYEDIIKKICGGNNNQKCTFCGVDIVVTEEFEIIVKSHNYAKSNAFFGPAVMGVYQCGSRDCFERAIEKQEEQDKFTFVVGQAAIQREHGKIMCDYCFKLGPIIEGHRCNSCLTVMYCSRDCRKEDIKNHKEKFCKNIEDWKIKEDRDVRTAEAKTRQKLMNAKFSKQDSQDLDCIDFLDEVMGAFSLEDDKNR